MITVSIISASLVILLSAFNGLEGKIEELFNAFDPDLKVQPISGKTISINDEIFKKIKSIQGIDQVSGVIEESVLFVYNGQQYIGKMKGVDDAYLNMVRMDTLVHTGKPLLKSGKTRYALLGEELATALNIDVNDPTHFLTIYYPKRGKIDLFNPFKEAGIYPGGIFSIQQEFNQYAIVPIEMAELITKYENQVTAIEIKLNDISDESFVKNEIFQLLNEKVTIKNRYEQQELMFKILKSEKLAMYLIVTLILVIASFNLISSLTMLVVEKKKDIMVLWSLGATFSKVKQIYITESTLVAVFGAVIGLVFGVLIVLLQDYFGFVRLGNTPESGEYPVLIKFSDILIIFTTVTFIGFLASWLRMKSIRLNNQNQSSLLK